MSQLVTLAAAEALPAWRRPTALLFVMAAAMPVAFATWSALINNFVIEVAGFDGSDIGWLHTVREVPGLLAVGVISLLTVFREQTLGLISLALLGLATAVTAWFPTMGGILTITLLSSFGFHYFETVNQSLQLQWIDKARAPQMLGWLMAAGSASTLVAYGLIVLTWDALGLTYNIVYMLSGGFTALAALAAWAFWPQFETPHPQNISMVLRRRYWLYYLHQFMSGARRQIFVVFAGFMMVERFGFSVSQITALFMLNLVVNIFFAPLIGRMVQDFGERRALMLEYAGLTLVFVAYGGIYWFGWGVLVASVLYVIDNLFFALSLSLRTYFQKIADPADIAPTAAVSFTINHIAAVFLPVTLGYVWLVSPAGVYVLGAAMAAATFVLASFVPRHPAPGNETIFARPRALAV
ncbi:MAG: MFS transporter [Rubellimicrobium sp.]|nr:MFS transporter [Rubellimicrobium sp.]